MGDLVNDVRSVLGANYLTATGIDLDGSFTVTREEISNALGFWTPYAASQARLGKELNNAQLIEQAADYGRLVDRLRELEARIPQGAGVSYVSPEFRRAFAHLEDRVQDILARADLLGNRDGVPTESELDEFGRGYEAHLKRCARAAELSQMPDRVEAFREALTLLPDRMRRAREALQDACANGPATLPAAPVLLTQPETGD